MGGARQPLGCVRLGASSRPGPLCSPGAAASLQLPPAPRGLHPCQNIPTGWEQPRDHPGGTHGVDSVMAPCGCARIEVGAEQAGVHPQNTFRSPSLMELSGDTRPRAWAGCGAQHSQHGDGAASCSGGAKEPTRGFTYLSFWMAESWPDVCLLSAVGCWFFLHLQGIFTAWCSANMSSPRGAGGRVCWEPSLGQWCPAVPVDAGGRTVCCLRCHLCL